MRVAGAEEVEAALGRGAFDDAITLVRDLVTADRRVLADPAVKQWCGRRWRNIFITEAAADPKAVDVASQRIALPGTDLSLKTGRDRRPDRQRVAERFLRGAGEEWAEEMPAAEVADPARTALVFCPGLVGTIFPVRGFAKAFTGLAARHGWQIIAADSHPMRSCAANIADLEAAVERGIGLDARSEPIDPADAKPPERVFLLGYSKGSPDALALLVKRPDLAERVTAVISWGGAVGGSYLADDMYETLAGVELPAGTAGDAIRAALKAVFPMIRMSEIGRRFDEYDIRGAIDDLRTETRAAWMAANGEALDRLGTPIFNVTGATTALEVPYFQAQGYLRIARTDPDNDMQVTQEQARVRLPMATDLAVLNAHHWDMSYDAFPAGARLGSPNLEHPFPKAAAVTAHFKLLGELGLVD